jgi:uncharacterized membrane protein
MDSPTLTNPQVPVVRADTWWDRLWRPFWMLPMAICLVAFLLGLLLPRLDRELDDGLPFVFNGGPDAALSVLSTIATSMISVTGLVFSITIVVLQLASSQFTPRVLSTFLSSRITQTTLGVFLATFIYALTVMRSVQGGFQDAEPFVPQTSVTVAYAFVVASLGLFLAFIRHVTTSIQVAHVMSGIGDRAVQAVDELYPARAGESLASGPTWSPSAGTARVEVPCARRHGSVTEVDFRALAGLATAHDVVIEMQVQSGDFVVEGQALARVWGAASLPEDAAIAISDAVGLGPERLMNQDLAFGIRQLVDIAERALSPSLNDPTTACQVIDQLHRILRPLVGRESPSPYVADDAGVVRVVYRPQKVEQLITAALGEVAYFGRDSPPVVECLRALLDELPTAADPRYLPTLEQVRAHL